MHIHICVYIYIYICIVVASVMTSLALARAAISSPRLLVSASKSSALVSLIYIYIYTYYVFIYLYLYLSLSTYTYIYIHMHISLYVFQIIHSPALVMPSTQSLHAFQITSFEHEIPLQESQAGDISQGCSLTLSRPWSCSRGGGRRAPRCRPRGPRRGFLRSERERERSSEFFCLFDSEESFWFLGGPLTPDTDSERSLEVIF